MGMFDSIDVWMECPYCKKVGSIDCQTKDLSKSLYQYKTIKPEIDKNEKAFRSKLPVFPSFPGDKGIVLWSNQKEKSDSMATVPDEFKKLKYVSVIASCNSVKCRFDGHRYSLLYQNTPSGFSRSFYGKIKVSRGKLTGEVYDIKLDGLKEKDFEKYKDKHPAMFKQLMKKYKHEPIALEYWSNEYYKKEMEKNEEKNRTNKRNLDRTKSISKRRTKQRRSKKV